MAKGRKLLLIIRFILCDGEDVAFANLQRNCAQYTSELTLVHLVVAEV